MSSVPQPTSIPAFTGLRSAWALRHPSVRANGIVPIIITIAIIALLVMAASIVAAAVILCAQHGGVLDGVVNLNAWTVQIKCHKL